MSILISPKYYLKRLPYLKGSVSSATSVTKPYFSATSVTKPIEPTNDCAARTSTIQSEFMRVLLALLDTLPVDSPPRPQTSNISAICALSGGSHISCLIIVPILAQKLRNRPTVFGGYTRIQITSIYQHMRLQFSDFKLLEAQAVSFLKGTSLTRALNTQFIFR